MSFSFHAVTPARWPDFAKLFEAPGGPKNCWCMVWRATAEERKGFTAAMREVRPKGQPAPSSVLRRKAMEKRVKGGTPVGILAYADGDPVGWCSVAPRPTYLRLGGPKDYAENPGAVWSIACFFIAKAWRGKGLSGRLIEAAVAEAKEHGAAIVEAYPVPPDAPSYRFMGLDPMFERAGFQAIAKAGTRRTVMRRALSSR